MKRRIALGMAAALFVTACASTSGLDVRSDPDTTFTPVPVAEAPAFADVAAASRAFGHDLLKSAEREDNLVLSPLSLTLALGMLGEGASNDAVAELRAALGAGGDEASAAMAAILTALQPYDADPGDFDPEAKPPDKPLLHVANQIVLDDEIDVVDDYLTRLKRYHDGGIAEADLGSDDGKKLLDAWVKHHSGGLIEESAIKPDPRLRAALQNATLFAARWRVPFDEARDMPFTPPGGTTIQVPMVADDRRVPWVRVEDWEAIELAYTEDFTAVVILPPLGSDPAELPTPRLEAILTGLPGAKQSFIRMAMPTLNLATGLDLVPLLADNGVSALLDQGAQPLRGITAPADPSEDLALTQAVQQARLIVDEEGTIAAAVTEVGLGATSAPPQPEVEFIVDRPYAFLIQHAETGLTLFHAVVRNPAATD